MPNTLPMYPLLFDPIYKEKVWGGRSLERLGRQLPGNATTPIGESWELVDLASTSVSGGGGGAEHSTLSDGPLAGTRINALLAEHAPAILGNDRADVVGFPLLIKYLDACENLSVQVHPSPAYADAHPEAHLKSEAWYVVDRAPGAVIYKGLRPGVSADQLRAALQANTDDAVVPLLNAVPVEPGDCHYLPSGTCHALGAGVLVAEVQTPSDTTFRVYDWGRVGRELHVDQALACIDFDDPAGDGPNAWEVRATRSLDGASATALVRCPYFEIERVDAEPGFAGSFAMRGPEVWMVLAGGIRVHGGAGEPVAIAPGRTALIPAGLGVVQTETSGHASWLRVTVPAKG